MKRRIAIWLLGVASRILPASRREWLRDMRGELDYVKCDGVALRWALGCVTASIQERVDTMLNSNGKISRPVLVLEWLTCFVPLTLVWFAGVRYIVNIGTSTDILLATAFCTLGPIALCTALIATVTRKNVGVVAKSIVGALAVLATLQLADMGSAETWNLTWFEFEPGTFVLLTLLPLIGAAHLVHLSRPAEHTVAAT